MKNKIMHAIFGHKFYWVYTEDNKDSPYSPTNHYYCSWCEADFTTGMYHWIYDSKNKRVK